MSLSHVTGFGTTCCHRGHCHTPSTCSTFLTLRHTSCKSTHSSALVDHHRGTPRAVEAGIFFMTVWQVCRGILIECHIIAATRALSHGSTSTSASRLAATHWLLKAVVCNTYCCCSSIYCMMSAFVLISLPKPSIPLACLFSMAWRHTAGQVHTVPVFCYREIPTVLTSIHTRHN